MIKFFRKIRQNMIKENKFSKYFLYAVGEIILVVIGILIALSINNWNQSKKQDIAEKEFIEGIKNDLKQDKQYMELIIRHIEPKIEAYTILDKEFTMLYKKDKNALDSLFQIYFVSQRTFYPISGSFQAAIAGNEINAFKNKELTRVIIKLYNSTYDRLVDIGETTNERWEYLSRKYSHLRRTVSFRILNETQLSDLLDDMYHLSAQLLYYQNQLNKDIAKIDAILKED
jgi:hypothetical protein